MTIRVFSERTRLGAWEKATKFLIENGETLNVLLDIEQPLDEPPAAKRLYAELDRLYAGADQLPIRSVAETIFPAWQFLRNGVFGVYERYPAEYRLMKARDAPRWGTYAARLVYRVDSKGNTVNPLANLVEKLRKATIGEVAAYRSAYELGVEDYSMEIPIHENRRDGGPYIGGPCLTHLSFKLVRGNVHLTALYRNHDYFFKVPGNLLGLARLQAFVCHEAGADAGSLTIHSTNAFLDSGKGRARLKELVNPGRAE